MSLTSYRTAPPRVTDFHYASDARGGLPKRLRGPYGRGKIRGIQHQTGRAALSHPGAGVKILKEALFSLFSGAAHAFGLADLAATYSPVS